MIIPITFGSVYRQPTHKLGCPVETRLHTIASVVAPILGWTVHELRALWRTGASSQARHVVMYVQKVTTPFTCVELGRYWKQDHSTVVYGIRAVKDEMSVDTRFRSIVEGVISAVHGCGAAHPCFNVAPAQTAQPLPTPTAPGGH